MRHPPAPLGCSLGSVQESSQRVKNQEQEGWLGQLGPGSDGGQSQLRDSGAGRVGASSSLRVGVGVGAGEGGAGKLVLQTLRPPERGKLCASGRWGKTYSCLSPFLTEDEVLENVSPICPSKAFPQWARQGTPEPQPTHRLLRVL